MSVSKKAPTVHTQPIYFVEFVGGVLTTNTDASGDKIGADGYPVQYRQHIELSSGKCACTCTGFADSIMTKATREGVVPTVHNGRTCKHIRKAEVEARGWGYTVAALEATLTQTVAAPAAPINYADFFESYD